MKKLVFYNVLMLMIAGLSLNSVYGQDKKEDVNKMDKKEMRISNDDKMNYTPEQKKAIKDLKVQMQKEVTPLKNELREKQAKLHSLTSAEKPDMTAINATIDEMSVLKGKIMKLQTANKVEVRKHLNDEQKVMFDKRMDMEMMDKEHKVMQMKK